MNVITKNRELGDFLKRRRQTILPTQVGLPDGKRRRTPGLRREEVALLSGVSISWYTWLEQGKEIQVSSQVLLSIAKTLLLKPADIQYILALAGFNSAALNQSSEHEVSPMVQHVLDSLTTAPSIILDNHWNILAWNRIASVVFCNFKLLAPSDRNLLKLLFLDSTFKKLYRYPDWETKAKMALANFRRSFIHIIDEPQSILFIKEMSERSPEFKKWWSDHAIESEEQLTKTILHPVFGELTFEHTSYTLSNKDDIKMYVNLPKKGSATEKKIVDLIIK